MRKPHPGSGFIPVDLIPGAVDIEDLAAAHYALEQALEYGNLQPLIDRLRTAKTLFSEERALAADIVGGVWKRPAHRIALHPNAKRFHASYLALCVLERRLNGQPHKAAVDDVAKTAEVSESQVRKAIRQHEDLFGSLLRNRRRSGKQVRT
jgi:hypothetical protein